MEVPWFGDVAGSDGPTTLDAAARRRFNAALARWRNANGRRLEIRQARTGWEILVAEVMSQQTQIERIGPKWRSFVERWPDAASLAGATTGDLLAAWSGLGYNRRALSLRDAARRIVEHHRGHVPRTVEALEGLPGIGPYTARAVVASLGTPVAPVDVNIRRVMSRLAGRRLLEREVQAVANGLVSRSNPRAWVNALMDLAATVCTARVARCSECPVSRFCQSRGVDPMPAPRTRREPFPTTRRWLRGRLLSLIVASRGSWVPLPASFGAHDREAVVATAQRLALEGFIDVRGGFARIRERGPAGSSTT